MCTRQPVFAFARYGLWRTLDQRVVGKCSFCKMKRLMVELKVITLLLYSARCSNFAIPSPDPARCRFTFCGERACNAQDHSFAGLPGIRTAVSMEHCVKEGFPLT